jgi:hypothetical protein
MTVAELMKLLRGAEPEAEVSFMQPYADADEADAVEIVDIQTTAWTFERGRYGAGSYSAYYAGEPEPRGDGYQSVEYRRLSVVVLRPLGS